MSHEAFEAGRAKRSISARQFAINDAGTTNRLGSFATLPRFFFSSTSSAMTLNGLPQTGA